MKIPRSNFEGSRSLLQSDKPNLAKPERELGLRYGRLRGPVHGRKGHSNIASQSKALNPIQERALRSCVISVHRAYCLSYSDITERAANRLLERAGSDRLVAHNWVYRFMERLSPDIRYINPKPTEKSSDGSENFGELSLLV